MPLSSNSSSISITFNTITQDLVNSSSLLPSFCYSKHIAAVPFFTALSPAKFFPLISFPAASNHSKKDHKSFCPLKKHDIHRPHNPMTT
ncbi:hypothetical protein L2E82_22657 [Cichorium intybus]|uniref:Uncharacterized protein n=1 Tax=Cichorium intybus TaxID=13427 RepID=A0ACB9DXZ3_CICIN|nr:hypothetical protein L2E82_22657 [Cichorium intybus]